MIIPDRAPNWFRRTNTWLAGTWPITWLAARMLYRLDRAILRFSGGRWTAAGLLTGLPMLTLTTTGARSGQSRSIPLVGIPLGDEIMVIASNWGQAQHPAWYYNLRAYPEAMIAVDGRVGTFVAREATAAEREGYWHLADARYPGYAAYRQRAGNRRIPIMILAPQTN